MIQTRRLSGEYLRWAPLGPGGDPAMSLQGGRLGAIPGASYGDYGDVVQLTGRPRRRLGELVRWSRLGPGGDPRMSLQGCGPGCGCGPCRTNGLSGIPTTMAEVDWTQMIIGAALGAAALHVARSKGWV